MMSIAKIWTKIQRKWIKIRLHPIRVYCFHHVCARYDADSMNRGDWMQIEEFKRKIQKMQQDGVELISLADAYSHICQDWIRCKKYAVLTFDDGYTSIKEILPWLEENQIPVIMFINGQYLDGKSYRKTPKEHYLTKAELFALSSPFIEIGSHGWEHTDAAQLTEAEFAQSVERNVQLLSSHPRYVPFHAYTWGRHTESSDKILNDHGIIPVLMDGDKNYTVNQSIHRELLNIC